MSRLENLPVDIHSPTENEHKIINVLFGDEDNEKRKPSGRYPVLQGFEESLTIIVLFLFFTIPQITERIHMLPMVGNSFVIECLVKIVLILVLYGIIKNYLL